MDSFNRPDEDVSCIVSYFDTHDLTFNNRVLKVKLTMISNLLYITFFFSHAYLFIIFIKKISNVQSIYNLEDSFCNLSLINAIGSCCTHLAVLSANAAFALP